MIRAFFRFALLLCLAWSSHAQQREQRVALVIGNAAYPSAPLRNPVNDAKDMADKLRGLGFVVIERSNLGIKQIGSTLREFRAKLVPGGVALVYYAGHGLQIKGENYLPAVDAEIAGEEDVSNQSLAIRQIMDVLTDAKTRLNLVFLDACRNNPYARTFRNANEGLSKVAAPSGTLISFATRPGSVAEDGVGRNGLYTGALLQQMGNPNQSIEQVLKRVVTAVKAGSKNQQEPWMEGSIEGEFCFGDCARANQPPVVVAQASNTSDDRFFWESVKDTKDANELKAYLNKFPGGLFAELAGIRLRGLEQAAAERIAAEAAQRAALERAAAEAAVKEQQRQAMEAQAKEQTRLALLAQEQARVAAEAAQRLAAARLFPGGAFANEEAVLSTLKPVAEAMLRGDLAAGIEIMYEPMATDLGGKKTLLAALATVKEQLTALGLRIRKYEFVPPFRFISGTKRQYVIVPTLMEMGFAKGIVRAHGFQLGVEVAPGVWQFADGEGITREVVNKYFPDFPADEKLPEGKQEIIQK